MRTYATEQKRLTRACLPMQQCRNVFAMENIANLSLVLREHRADCLFPPVLLLSRRNQSPDAVRSRNPSTSTLAHERKHLLTN